MIYKNVKGSDEEEEQRTREKSRSRLDSYVDYEEDDAIPLQKIQGNDGRGSFSGKPVVGRYEHASENGRKRRRLSQYRADHGSSQAFYTAEEERKVVRQLDRNLVLFLAFLYMLSFLDRSSLYIPFTSFKPRSKGTHKEILTEETLFGRHWKCL